MTELRVSNKLWLISDTHFGHRNIIKFQQRPESHEAIMLSEWIYAVRDEDQILHLGDVFLGPAGSPMRWAAIISRMPGQKFLILGNHDKAKRSTYERAGFTIIDPFVHQGIAFTHCPISVQLLEDDSKYVPLEVRVGITGWSVNVHGHTHSNEHRGEYDGTPLDGDHRYVNVCVEMTGLKPVRLGNICPLPKGAA